MGPHKQPFNNSIPLSTTNNTSLMGNFNPLIALDTFDQQIIPEGANKS